MSFAQSFGKYLYRQRWPSRSRLAGVRPRLVTSICLVAGAWLPSFVAAQTTSKVGGYTETSERLPATEKLPATPSSVHEKALKPAQLVEMLGSAKYAQRERATLLLLQIGDAAVPALQSQVSHPNLEVRRRASVILEQIQAETFDIVADKFLLEADPTLSYGLPAWGAFREIVGHSRSSKLLFIESVRCQRALMQIVDVYVSADADKKTGVLRRAVEALASATASQVQRDQVNYAPLRLGDFTSLMLAVAVVDQQAPVVVNETLETNIHRWVFTEHLRLQGFGHCLRQLMSQWIPKTHDDMAARAMRIALAYDLDSGVIVARKHLTKASDLLSRTTALQVISCFGNETDLPIVAELLDDDELLLSLFADDIANAASPQIDESYSAPPGFDSPPLPSQKRRFVVQVNDLALATACTLAGEDPKEYFPAFRMLQGYGVDTRSIACPADAPELREARIERFRAEHLPSAPSS